MMIDILWLFIFLQLKHFIIDFPLQGPYQYLNKGAYGHPGGLLHSVLHGVGTFIVFFILYEWIIISFWAYLLMGIVVSEIFLHYHIDWAKMNINKMMSWGPTTTEQFWWLLGFDQLLHQWTYIAIVYAFYAYPFGGIL